MPGQRSDAEMWNSLIFSPLVAKTETYKSGQAKACGPCEVITVTLGQHPLGPLWSSGTQFEHHMTGRVIPAVDQGEHWEVKVKTKSRVFCVKAVTNEGGHWNKQEKGHQNEAHVCRATITRTDLEHIAVQKPQHNSPQPAAEVMTYHSFIG